jgi:hypothetical protein
VELGADRVRDVTLWLFDGEGRFLETVPARVGEPVDVTVPVDCEVEVVAWGNLGSRLQDVSEGGVWKDEYRVNLIPDHVNGQGHASPDDLYHGRMTLPAQNAEAATRQEDETTLPIRCVVSGVTVTLRNLELLTGYDDWDELNVVVRETVSWLDFDGAAGGDPAAYYPAGSFVEGAGDSEFFVPLFNIIPGKRGLVIEVYGGGELLFSVTGDTYGNPILPQQGGATNVLVDASEHGDKGERGLIEVQIALMPWGEYNLWMEF